MTISRGTWVKNNGVVGNNPLEARRSLGGQFFETSPGVVRSGLLSDAPNPAFQLVTGAAGLFYTVAAFPLFIIGRAANEGCYTLTGQGTTNTGNVAAAPAAGLSRWDLIYLKQNDLDKGEADNLPVLGVAQGAAAASPTKPTASVPAGAEVIAEAQIFSGTTATNQAPNTIAQVWRYTAHKGVPVPVRNTTERGEIAAPATNTRAFQLDLGRVLRWNGTRWANDNDTILGRGALGAVVTLAATPSWSTIATVNGTSSGGEVIVDFGVTTINANSGDHRTAAIRVQCDGVNIDSYSYFAQYVATANAPQFPGFGWAHTPAAGAHTWTLQGNANVGGAIQAIKGTMTVTERP